MKSLWFGFIALIGSTVAKNNILTWTLQEIFPGLIRAKDASAPVPELVVKHNYGIEVHHVKTIDDYILKMHRIPGSPTSPAAHGKPVVFLMHGLLSSSVDWVMMGPEKGLGYILADAGYDVWMGNARGNTYSRNHTTADTSSEEFWDFSWHEIGIYDLPAMIDFALETTGQRKVAYVGHSQGSTSFFVMTSQKTDYNDKDIVDLFDLHSLSPFPRSIRTATGAFCGDDFLSQFLCSNIIFIMGGYDKAQLNTSMLPTIFGHLPAGASFRQLLHYGQEVESHKFRQYDYGPAGNEARYGSVSPPDYNLSLITAPVHVIYGLNDWLVAVEDVSQLYNELGNPIEMRQVPNEKWTHFDPVWGINAKELVYDHILATLRESYNFTFS